MRTIATRATRATPISRVPATWRVPFGLMPVIAATAVMTTARISHVSQVTWTPLAGRLDALEGAREPVEDHVRSCVVQDEIVSEKAVLDPIGKNGEHGQNASGHR